VLAGAVVASGELHARVAETGANTFFGKTMALLAAPEEQGHLQTVRLLMHLTVCLYVPAHWACGLQNETSALLGFQQCHACAAAPPMPAKHLLH
jgi:magnesium-transporting ATPase (P-type)